MAANPMQKKVRNSFLLGVMITLIICILIVGLLYFLFFSEQFKSNGEEVKAYVLNRDIKSGQTITTDMLTETILYSNMIPANYITPEVMGGVSVVAKINMSANTVLTIDSVAKSDESITNDLRIVEYNMLTLPIDVNVGDYVDIRLTFPNGQDYIVVSKKQIKSISGNTVKFKMTEDEILMMSSAIVESYVMTGSNIYIIKYAEPGLQVKATNTYVPTVEVRNLIETDSNIVETAKNKLKARFESANTRGDMDSAHSQYSMEELDNVEAGIRKQIEDAKEAREQYLQSLEQ